MKLSLISLIAALAAAPLAFGAEWLDNLANAQAAAIEQGKDILVLYRGDNFSKADDSPAPHFHSPHFSDKAAERYVLVELPAPVQTNGEGKPYSSTAVVFTTAEGRPYYMYSSEWHNGIDWSREELAIAAEQRPAVEAVWKQMDTRPEGTAETAYALPLFSAMPDGIELFYAPYARLHEDAKANDPAFAEAVAARAARDKRYADILQRIVLCMGSGSEEGVRQLVNMDLGLSEAEWEEMPIARQCAYLTGQYVLWGATTFPLLDNKELSDAQKDELVFGSPARRAIILRSIRIAPRSKMARLLRVCGMRKLDIIALAMRSRCYTEDPAKALAYIDETEAQAGDSCMARQFCALIRGRVFIEMARWDEAETELLRAEQLEPSTTNAKTARSLRERLTTRRAELEALAERRRAGDESATAEWRRLLEMQLAYGFDFRVVDLHLSYESDATVAAMEKLAAETEAALDRKEMEMTAESIDKYFTSTATMGDSSVEDKFKGGWDDILARAEQGDIEAMKFAFVRYCFKGKEGEAEAIAMLRRIAEAGDAEAQYRLAARYRKGEGVAMDDSTAVHWLKLAAGQGYASAQCEMGVRSIEGMGVPKDLAAAEQWLLKAAEQGDVTAQGNLGGFYYNGLSERGIEVDKALTWLNKAAAQGEAQSQFVLGMLYYYCDKVEEDMMKAEYWLQKAADKGDPNAKTLLNAIRSADDPFLNGMLEEED